MNKKELSQVVKKIAEFHNQEAHKHNYNWIRTCVTILTPSLALLIGLQDTALLGKCLTKYFLVASIVSMTTTILLGLLSLHGEVKLHLVARDQVIEEWNTTEQIEKIKIMNVVLPKQYLIAFACFPYAFWVSIFLLGILGVIKTIS